MQAVILAAGRGTRMKSLTRSTNKVMLKIKGKPLLEHKIKALPRKIKDVVIIVGYYGAHITKYFKKRYDGRKITYVFQKKMNGTGGAVCIARSVLKDRFLVMNGDDLYVKKDLEELTKYDLAVLGYEVKDTSKYGVIKTDGRGNMVDIIEKPKRSKDKLIAAGAYMLNKKFFNYDLAPIGGGEFGLPQTMAKMAKDYKIKVKKAHDWYPIGNPEDYKKAEEIIGKFI